MTARSTWTAARLAAFTRQEGRCAGCNKRLVTFDCLRGARVEAFCRRCRVRKQRFQIIARARATRARRQAQLRLPNVRRSAA